MKQKYKLLNLLKTKPAVKSEEAKRQGVRNPRQQVYFLRQAGHRIINSGHREYRLLQ